MKKKLLLGLLLIFVLIQFKRIDRTNPPITEDQQDFFALHDAPVEIRDLVHIACYDCHSFTTDFPWYSHIAPVSWWLDGHIRHAREQLNFSTWNELEPGDEKHLFKEIQRVLVKKEMPMLPYMIAHNGAWLDDDQRSFLSDYFKLQENRADRPH